MEKKLMSQNVGTMVLLKQKAESMTRGKFRNFLKNCICANKSQIIILTSLMTFIERKKNEKKVDIDEIVIEEVKDSKSTGQSLLNMLGIGL